ncbi:hypothetical protein ABK905_13755 [Acerihabitans sp. KWT182]|uniref:Uncharacterized protein n=1 Tax=Acerihabitans sp. KWT182 TaxID=3157919 RepID=A0AAU7Q6V5_9GAMM
MPGDGALADGLPWTHWRDLLLKPLDWCDRLKRLPAGKRVFVEISPHPLLLPTLPWENGDEGIAVASARKGHSATNVMEEAATLLRRHGVAVSRPSAVSVKGGIGSRQPSNRLLTVSARRPDMLGARCAQLAALLEDSAVSLPDLSFTLAARTVHYAHRTAFVVADRAEALRLLTAFAGESARTDAVEPEHGPAKRVGLLCSHSHWISPEDLAVLLEHTAFRLAYLRGRNVLRTLSISDTSGIGAAFLQQIALAALLSWYGVERTDFLGDGPGGLIAAHLNGALTFSEAVAQLRRYTHEPPSAASEYQGERGRQSRPPTPPRLNQRKLLCRWRQNTDIRPSCP